MHQNEPSGSGPEDAVDLRQDVKRFHSVKKVIKDLFKSESKRLKLAEIAYQQNLFGFKTKVQAAKRKDLQSDGPHR